MILNELKHISQTNKSLREFGLLVGGVFVILGLFIFEFVPLTVLGIVLMLVGLVQPQILKYPHTVWMAIALAMGWVMTRVILLIVFVVAIIPIKLILQLKGEPPVDTRINKRAKSYWISRQGSKEYGNLEKQF